jgi:SAM-dependent methyltransferase
MSRVRHVARRATPVAGTGATLPGTVPPPPCGVARRRLAAALLAMLAPVPAGRAQAPALDVPFVPTADETVDRMLRLAGVGPEDRLIDLGSGDGRIVIAAARQFGTRGLGVELDPGRRALAQRNAERAGVADRVQFQQQDLFDTDLSSATVITMYLLPAVNLRLRPRLLALRPGTRVVSHDFDMGEWPPDQRADRGGSTVYVWIVPARVEGEWRWRLPGAGEFTARLRQQFQQIHGLVQREDEPVWLQDARLRGADVGFTLIGQAGANRFRHEYSGRVEGEEIRGSVRVAVGEGVAGRPQPWRAVRAA